SPFFVSSSLIISFADFLKADSVCPNADPISGSFFGPKIISAIITIRIRPGTPIFDKLIVIAPFLEVVKKSGRDVGTGELSQSHLGRGTRRHVPTHVDWSFSFGQTDRRDLSISQYLQHRHRSVQLLFL